MGIGYRIKEARERLNLTQTELGALVGVTGSAITNYEKETSHPKEQVIYKLMEHLNVDANYLFQDVVKIPQNSNDFSPSEYEHIKKYRDLDDHGKEMVDIVLTKEHERCDNAAKTTKTAAKIAALESENYLNAAHDMGATSEQKAHADSIMEDDSEWE